jgi:mono/diheme cytochrome c family protein
MAATDQLYRNQKLLDITFGVTSILMLLSIVGMFTQDYFRSFKVEQRAFRDVEYGLAQRSMLDALPQQYLTTLVAAEKEGDDAKKEEAIKGLSAYLGNFGNAEKALFDARQVVVQRRQDAASQIHAAKVAVELNDGKYRSLKATYDSKESLYNIAVDERDNAPNSSAEHKIKEADVAALRKELDDLRSQRDQAKVDLEKSKQAQRDAEANAAEAEQEATRLEAVVKKQRADLDRLDKLALQKRWKTTDWILSLPVIDGFASPYKIQQYTLNDLPIDYYFKMVTRFDRCTTCHLGMERANYDRKSLEELVKAPDYLQANLDKFRGILASPPAGLQDAVATYKAAFETRRKNRKWGEDIGFTPDDLPTKVPTVPGSELTAPRITQFAAHPRLDLFVDANSPHPVERFGCTSCHSGQGSATDFFYAAHTPDSVKQTEEWQKAHSWEHSHFWDYPMLAKRFEESSCLKCHHQVTDLIRYGNKVEAPKLVRGYQLVREVGCFGCHEIAAMKSGREIGPDLRLEPTIPLDKMDPLERAKLLADTLNPPGNMRKVGPSLFRISEKTNAEWMRKWVWSPRGFRPDTKMPHFYGVSNNSEEALKGTEQQDFPSAEVGAVVFYLLRESQNYMKGDSAYKRLNEARRKQLEDNKYRTDAEEKELREVILRLQDPKATAPLLELREVPTPLDKQIVDMDGRVVKLPEPAKDRAAQLKNGRKLFTEKGCLGCHAHDGTAKAGDGFVAVVSEANFGPNLSHVAAKLGTKPGDHESARRWLVQWILNPQVYHPRTRMPFTHLDVQEADDVAAWLLEEGKNAPGSEPPAVADEVDTYKKMTAVYLSKVRTQQDVQDLLSPADEKAKERSTKWLKDVRPESDEAFLAGDSPLEERLKMYVGRKAINRLGCFGCHNVPGFETAKPIGTPLNDWGKKDPERLAFEDIVAYVEDHHSMARQINDPKDPSLPSKEWAEGKEGKTPYQEYFYNALQHHQREGFLQQKLLEPRSYDYHRTRAWDDRLRMPQFQFARSRKKADESDEEYEVRQRTEEAEAREAVMTFILGLVAEAVPGRYLNTPTGDRLAEVKGRHVLEQANCGGCHQVRPGVYEFKPTAEGAMDRLLASQKTAAGKSASDYAFPEHNAWAGLPPPWPDRLLAHGLGYHTEEIDGQQVPFIRLAEALRFTAPDKVTQEVPAGAALQLPDTLLSRQDPLGGAFVDLLIEYNKKMYSQKYPDNDKARSALPPQLFREGERTQPEWLFQFLRNPGVLRSQSWMLLRMPKFNLSDDELMALVNYFNALDKVNNPGIGLNYPYQSVKQRDEQFWREATTKYRERLGKAKVDERAKELEPLWKQALEDQLTEAKRRLDAAKAAIEATKAAADAAKDDKKKEAEEARKKAEQDRDAAQAEVTRLEKKDISPLRKEWEETGVYASDGYRLLLRNNAGVCLTCHNVGSFTTGDAKGPPLELSAARLRPEWTMRWLANPDRLMYPTIMPQNFPNGQAKDTDIFSGSPLEQGTAVRDVLLDFPKVADRPENRYYRPAPGGAK